MIDDYLFLNEVPEEANKYVLRLRRYLEDFTESNELLGVEESTDLELFNALIDTWDQVNNEFEPVDLHTSHFSRIPWSILRQGAVLNVLVSQSILSARNVLSYNDSGGITVKDQDVYGRYMALFNMLIAQYRRGAQAYKRLMNINGAYGGSHSEYYFNNSGH